MSHIVVFITCANIDEAKKITYSLVSEKLVACVNIVKDVTSVFWWQGKIDNAKEILLIVKTKKSLFIKLTKKVKSLHSYKVPEIIAIPIISGNADYLKWIDDSTA